MPLSRKKRRLLFLSVPFILVLLWLIPYILQVEQVQRRISTALEQCYRMDVKISDMRFSWLPSPHISLGSTTLENELFSATINDVAIYPALKIPWLQSGNPIARITLEKPHVTLRSWPAADGAAKEPSWQLPARTIVIKQGTITLPELSQNDIHLTRQTISQLDATLRTDKDKIGYTVQGRSSVAEEIHATGYVTAAGGGEAELHFQKFQLAGLGSYHNNSVIQPGTLAADFDIKAFWQGSNIDLQFQGALPDFFLRRLQAKEHFVLPVADFRLRLTGNEVSVNIEALHVAAPRAVFSGKISRKGSGEDARYLIDLDGQGIDLAAVRTRLLSLLPDSDIVQTVCDIVREGTAKKAHYFIDGPLSAFEYVSAMTIDVDVDDAWIHLADLPLDLHHASGPIQIKDGDITGSGITTSVGDSHGSQGSFLVGLADDRHGLQVNVLIDADLAALPATLRQLLPNENLKNELTRLEARGRATGRLRIDGTLDDFSTTVDVDEYTDATVTYGRLSWPIHLQSGRVQVSDHDATWQDVTGSVGLHQVSKTSGHIAWDQDNIPFAVTSLEGHLDLNTLHNELLTHPVLRDFLDPVLTGIQGGAEIKGEVTGDFFAPTSWIYNLDISLQDTLFSSPYFATMTHIPHGTATMSDKRLTLSSAQVTILEKEYHLNLDVKHQLWQNFTGEIVTDGVIDAPQVAWLRDHHLLPGLVDLVVPARLTNFHMQWNTEKTSLRGLLSNDARTVQADIDIITRKNLTSGTITLKNKAETAIFSGSLNPKKKIYDVDFKGRLRESTLDSLIDDKGFRLTSMNGDFHLNTWPDPNNAKQHWIFKGNLNCSGITLDWGEEKIPLLIQNIAVQGKGRTLLLDTLALRFQQAILLGRGKFITGPGTGHLEVKINSGSALTSSIVENFVDGYLLYFPPDSKGRKTVIDLSGDISFHLAHFTTPFGLSSGKDGKQPVLPFSPLNGHYSFSPHRSALDINDTQICGMFMDGRWRWQGEEGTEKSLRFQSRPEKPLNFKDFLTCLNFDAVVDGPLEIKGEIFTSRTICKQGEITLKSENGTIKRMVPLAKVLSLINITGLTGAIWHEGFYYHSFEITGSMCDNIFTVKKAFIDGDGVNIVAQGSMDFNRQIYDLTFYVVPFSSFNSLVTAVPLVGRIIGGKEKRVLSVPVRLSGSFADPDVQVLSATAVSKATAQWVLDTLTFPFDWAVPDKEPAEPTEITAEPTPTEPNMKDTP